MLTLAAGSYCDVCAEEYGAQCLPHAIPCGHVLCASCASTIAEKTPPRLQPVCPFCREQFNPEDVRLIRTDFTTSGWSTPRRVPPASIPDAASDVWARKAERILFSDSDGSKARDEARKFEDRVAKVAHKKSSVEEVSSLHKELEDWLTTSAKPEQKITSLWLSAALLRAILINHVAHSEASKASKATETALKGKLDDAEHTNSKLESELRRHQLQYSQKAQECDSLRTELSRLRVVATTLGVSPSAVNEGPRQSISPPISPPSTPVPTGPYPGHSPLSRYNSVHARSASMQASSRPTTPSNVQRPYTPSPTIPRSHTPVSQPSRSHTSMGMRFPTTSPSSLRAQTPAPPPIPPKPRRLSGSVPEAPKIYRSISDEKHDVHERWHPNVTPRDMKRYTSPAPQVTTRTFSSSASSAARLHDARSPSPA